MIRKTARRLLSVALAVMLSAMTLSSAFAYVVVVPFTVTLTGPTGTISCDLQYDFSATVQDPSGAKVAAQLVQWSIQKAPVGAVDSVTPLTSITNASGVAQTKIQFGGVAGARTIRAQAGASFTELIVNVTGCQIEPLPRLTAPCASALGPMIPPGPFDDSTKIAALGRYITWKLMFGPSYAGRLIQVTNAVRTPKTNQEAEAGVPITWSAFTNPTGRIADANGDVYVHYRRFFTEWISVRGFYPGTDTLNPKITLACQGRWRLIP